MEFRFGEHSGQSGQTTSKLILIRKFLHYLADKLYDFDLGETAICLKIL